MIMILQIKTICSETSNNFVPKRVLSSDKISKAGYYWSWKIWRKKENKLQKTLSYIADTLSQHLH